MKIIATLSLGMALAVLLPVAATAAPKELSCKLNQSSNTPSQLTIDESAGTAIWHPPFGARAHKADAEFTSDLIKWNYRDDDPQGHQSTVYFELNRMNGALLTRAVYDDSEQELHHKKAIFANYICSASVPVV
jgi:hypothetical protein